jgi:UDP-glucose 4-epimerase
MTVSVTDGADDLRSSAVSETLNFRYGHGHSMREMIESVRRFLPRSSRAGDPTTVVVDSRQLRQPLPLTHAYDDLDGIVGHALASERKLALQ